MLLVYATAACTLIAGILHLYLASNVIGNNLPVGIFFIVAGITGILDSANIKNLGKLWIYVGIGDTVILILLQLQDFHQPNNWKGPSCKLNGNHY